MPVNDNFGGTLGGIAAVPLISFHSIIDEDMACLKYGIIDIGRNPSFDIDSLKSKTYIEILADIYHRKYKNPLFYIASKNADIELLNRVYDEMLTTEEYAVLKHAVTTDMYNLLDDFKKASDIIPTVLYYTDSQLRILKSLPKISGIQTISINDATKKPNQWTQFYFKYLDEIKPFENLQDKTFYFSTSGLNLNKDNSDIIMSRDDIIDLVKKKNKISLYDIYRTDIIGSYNNDDN